MIICVCRNIKDSDFDNTQDMIDAVMSKEDLQCGKCQVYVKNSLMLEIGVQDGGSIPPISTRSILGFISAKVLLGTLFYLEDDAAKVRGHEKDLASEPFQYASDGDDQVSIGH